MKRKPKVWIKSISMLAVVLAAVWLFTACGGSLSAGEVGFEGLAWGMDEAEVTEACDEQLSLRTEREGYVAYVYDGVDYPLCGQLEGADGNVVANFYYGEEGLYKVVLFCHYGMGVPEEEVAGIFEEMQTHLKSVFGKAVEEDAPDGGAQAIYERSDTAVKLSHSSLEGDGGKMMVVTYEKRSAR